MKIHVSSLAKVHEVVAEHRPDRVISLLGPGSMFPVIADFPPGDHYKVELDDIRKPMAGYVTPEEGHLAKLIEFMQSWDPARVLVVHCWAGISRSSAAAMIAACLHNPDTDEAVIAKAIAEASPTAYPNTLIITLADKIMNRDGRMLAAAQAICDDPQRQITIRTIDEAEPFSIPAKF